MCEEFQESRGEVATFWVESRMQKAKKASPDETLHGTNCRKGSKARKPKLLSWEKGCIVRQFIKR